jgi:hypothetical protein
VICRFPNDELDGNEFEQLAFPLAWIPVEKNPDPHCVGVAASAVAVAALPLMLPASVPVDMNVPVTVRLFTESVVPAG